MVPDRITNSGFSHSGLPVVREAGRVRCDEGNDQARYRNQIERSAGLMNVSHGFIAIE